MNFNSVGEKYKEVSDVVSNKVKDTPLKVNEINLDKFRYLNRDINLDMVMGEISCCFEKNSQEILLAVHV